MLPLVMHMANSTTSSYNIAIGYRASITQTAAEYNVAIGGNASRLNQTGTRNVAIVIIAWMQT